MLSTKDNPYSPFTQFTEWYAFDEDLGYCSCGYLARIAKLSSGLSSEESSTEIERAVDEIIELNPLGIYIKVTYP